MTKQSEELKKCPICKKKDKDCTCESDFMDQYDNCYGYDDNGNVLGGQYGW